MKQTRRAFLAKSATVAFGSLALPACVHAPSKAGSAAIDQPWYRRTFRWGQTNITEADPPHYDIPWWRSYWRRSRVQGLIINAGGIVAYYPTRFPLQYRPSTLGERDLFGELTRAAHEEGLVVLARMDSSRAHEDLFNAHPDWFAIDSGGRPHKAGDLFITCVNGPYYEEYLPGILREIAERYRPEGFTDNSWAGLGRESICYCENCRKKFQQRTGHSLPTQKDWNALDYREWIEWNYSRRLELWDQNNRVTREAGGQNCLWVGMNSGSISGQSQSFRDVRGICARAEIILLDHQARSEGGSFAQNAESGQLIHSLLGWDKPIPESMAMYQAGRPTFRKTTNSEFEARLWMLEGLAGGLQPWWHHVGAQQEDLRQFSIAEPIYEWHQANQQYLINRRPVASVGLVWSQRNTDFFGRDRANELVELPWRGWAQALVRARIPFLPVHVDDLEEKGSELSVLILPNLGALSEAQAAAIRHFVERGGSLIATGRTGLYDEWGQPRHDFLLADLLGCRYAALRREGERPREPAGETLHSYLRIAGQNIADQNSSKRHPILAGFENTAILPYGGWLGDVLASPGSEVLLTYVPAFPVYPPETSWMREPQTNIPGLVLNRSGQNGRVAFLIADLDRRFATDNLPDHARLLANLVHWAANSHSPFEVEGPGLLDCHLYRQANRLILHVVNLTNTTARGPVDELIPVGPVKIRIRTLPGVARPPVRLLVARVKPSISFGREQVEVTLPSLLDHEVLVIG